jgi:hypothetical protein
MGSGALFKGSLGTMMMIADPDHRAETLAGLLLAGYLGLSVPAIGMGVALRQVSPEVTLLGFSLVVAAARVAAAPVLLRADRAVSVAGPAANSATLTVATALAPTTRPAEPVLGPDMAPVAAESRSMDMESPQAS